MQEQKLLKRCHQAQNVTVFSHSRIQNSKKLLSANHGRRQHFLAFHGPSILKYISSTWKFKILEKLYTKNVNSVFLLKKCHLPWISLLCSVTNLVQRAQKSKSDKENTDTCKFARNAKYLHFYRKWFLCLFQYNSVFISWKFYSESTTLDLESPSRYTDFSYIFSNFCCTHSRIWARSWKLDIIWPWIFPGFNCS